MIRRYLQLILRLQGDRAFCFLELFAPEGQINEKCECPICGCGLLYTSISLFFFPTRKRGHVDAWS